MFYLLIIQILLFLLENSQLEAECFHEIGLPKVASELIIKNSLIKLSFLYMIMNYEVSLIHKFFFYKNIIFFYNFCFYQTQPVPK